MSINTAHANRGVLIHSGEYILLHYRDVLIEFPNQKDQMFEGTITGLIYLTSHRIIFKSKRQTELLQSLSAPFIAIDDFLEQESINSTYLIEGKLWAQPNGNFSGELKFKLFFKSFQAIEFGKMLLCAISMTRGIETNRYLLPPYTPPRVWYEAPLELHYPPSEFKKWLPNADIFEIPLPNSVYMTDNAPPFPGIYIESKLNYCESSAMPSKRVKFPTPTESFDGFIHPPIYGVLTCTHQDGIFPHQAADPLFVQSASELPPCTQGSFFEYDGSEEELKDKN